MQPTPKKYISGEIHYGGERVDKPRPPEFQVCEHCETNRSDYRSPSPTPQATNEQFDAWNEYMARWRLDYPVKVRFAVAIDWLGHLRISFLYIDEPDSRDPSKMLPISMKGFLAPSLLPDENTPRWIRQNLRYHLDHELDENLKLDDAHPFDPHHVSAYWCEDCDRRLSAEYAARDVMESK